MINKFRVKPQKTKRLERGQSLVEISISLVFFFFFILGALDIGRIYFIYIALEDSASEAAMFLAIRPECDDYEVDTICTTENNAMWRARNAAGDDLDWSNAQIYVEYPTIGTGMGNLVRVRIEYPFQLLTPIISDIVGSNTLTLTSEATQVIMVEN